MDDQEFLRTAINISQESVTHGGFPAGAIIVQDGNVLGFGYSGVGSDDDPTNHAEVQALRSVCKTLGTTNLSGAVLYSSLEPCLMCYAAANWSGITKIVFACRRDQVKQEYYEGRHNLEMINTAARRPMSIVYIPEMEPIALRIMHDWEHRSSSS